MHNFLLGMLTVLATSRDLTYEQKSGSVGYLEYYENVIVASLTELLYDMA